MQKGKDVGANDTSIPCSFPGCFRHFVNLPALKLHQRSHTDGDYLSLKTDLDNVSSDATLGIRNENVAKNVRTVVFVGPYEHHSNLLPWRESTADLVVAIKEGSTGGVDLEDLRNQIAKYSTAIVKIGAFNAASNITGQLVDVDAVSKVLHEGGAITVWDYATAACHVKLDMNPSDSSAAKDAVVLSPHKFIGGPGTPGVLIIKKRLLTNAVPSTPGGGTVFFVTSSSHIYLENIEEREEGGTPDIIGAIRAGLVFHIKELVGVQRIQEREDAFMLKAWRKWSENSNILLLGHAPEECKRTSIISFLITYNKLFLHWNFVAALLNDVFGIQVRGGCVCAGPYAIKLLGITPDLASAFERELLEKDELVRPGFVRLSFPYFMTDIELDFVIKAVDWVATHGYKLLSQYFYYLESGEFKHRSVGTKKPHRKWLQSLSLHNRHANDTHADVKARSELSQQALYDSYFSEADRIIDDIEMASVGSGVLSGDELLSERARALKWFALPSDVAGTSDSSSNSFQNPLQPKRQYSVASHKKDVELGSGTGDPCVLLDNESSSPLRSHAITISKPQSFAIKIKTKPLDTCEIEGAVSRMIEPGSDIADGVEYSYSTCSSTGNVEYTAFVHRALSVPGSQSKSLKVRAKDNVLFPSVSKKILHHVGSAIRDFDMIRDGDRLLLGLSGGKDSLTMLHVLLHFQRVAPIKFEIGCVTIDPQAAGFDPRYIYIYIPYFTALILLSFV